jgi:asparagine synthase (glutamine-hydrolysing)
MCGIAGILTRGTPVEQSVLQAMGDRLTHRGPDGRGLFTHGPVGLVHTRLAIMDPAHGQQPLLDESARLALVANGEIYNYLELRQTLGPRQRFCTDSDSEAALRAYAVWGLEAFPRFHGMFAGALWDGLRRRLVLFRDRLGIKPLYYVELADRLLFASELKSLLAALPTVPAIDAQALAQFLTQGFTAGDRRLLLGIRELPPGEVLVVEPGLRAHRIRYWHLEPARLALASAEEAHEAFAGLADQVMREHLRSDVPYALFLSGGVDSSLLLSLLAPRWEGRITSYSLGYPETPERNENDAAARLARIVGSDHRDLAVGAEDLWRRLPHVVWALDEPMWDSACLPTSFLAEMASGAHKVVFTGEGGDEVFAGYGRYRRHPLQRAVKQVVFAETGGLRTGSWIDRGTWDALAGPELARQYHARRAATAALYGTLPGGLSALQRAQSLDVLTELRYGLLPKVDRVLMSHGVEGRVPYLDHRLVAFGLGLPDRYKVRGRVGKVFLRQAAAQRLPGDYLTARKRGFHTPVERLLRGHRLARLAEGLAASAAIKAWFRPDGLRYAVSVQERRGGLGRLLFGLLQFALWHRFFLEGQGRPGLDEDPLDCLA